jgi:hypothetical protein
MTAANQAPETTPIAAPVARVIAAYAHAGAAVPLLDFGPVRHIEGVDRPPHKQSSLELSSSGELTLQITTAGPSVHVVPPRVEVLLDDGSVVSSEDAYVCGARTACSQERVETITRVEMCEWRWFCSDTPVAWVGFLRGAYYDRASNLRVRGFGKESLASLRLEGNLAWNLTRASAGKRPGCVVVIDGADIDRAQLSDDFVALEFLFGTPLRLDMLVGVDDRNEPVAAVEVALGYRFGAHANREPPLPDARGPAWIALAFPAIVQALGHSPLCQ